MRATDFGLFVLRVGIGGTLAAHGLPKLLGGEGTEPPALLSRLMGSNYAKAWAEGGLENFAKALGHIGVPMPSASARASGLAEAAGGLALIAGVGFPATNAIVAGNMAVAIGKAHWKTGFYGQGGYELAAILGLGAAALVLTGPGDLSLDRLLR